MCKVSVIVPTYNHGHFIPDCLNSLLSQTFQDFEVIVVDDASTDNTTEVIVHYKKKFEKKLVYVRLEKRVGRGGIRNYGLKYAKGEYIAFLDSDDVYSPEKLRLQAEYLNKHRYVGAVSCQYYKVNHALQDLVLVAYTGSPYEILFGQHYTNIVGLPTALMIRREIIEQIGSFDERIIRGQDTDMAIRIFKACKVDLIPTPLFLYRIHNTNTFSPNSLRERTISNLVLFKKIINSEEGARKKLARKFAFICLRSHIFAVREKMYLYSIKVWLLYLWKLNFKLPILKWVILGFKIGLGYRFTQFIKKMLKAILKASSNIKRCPRKTGQGQKR